MRRLRGAGGGGESRCAAGGAEGERGAGCGGLSEVAAQLTARRTEAAKRLEKLAEAQINDLAMSTRFKVQVTAGRDRRTGLRTDGTRSSA